jgi:hypothetical protein
MEDAFVNKVAASGIITISPEDYLPKEAILSFDLKDYLFMGLILKEKDFRQALKDLDKSIYKDTIVALHCSTDAIIPMWANMLVVVSLQNDAAEVMYGDVEQVREKITLNNISAINVADYEDQRIVIKGCGELPIPESVYMALTKRLLPLAKSIMYGEPCSTVPVYKKSKL